MRKHLAITLLLFSHTVLSTPKSFMLPVFRYDLLESKAFLDKKFIFDLNDVKESLRILNIADLQQWLTVAEIFYGTNEKLVDTAEYIFEKLLTLENFLPPEVKVRVLVSLSQIADNQNRHIKSEKLAKEALDLEPKNPYALLRLADYWQDSEELIASQNYKAAKSLLKKEIPAHWWFLFRAELGIQGDTWRNQVQSREIFLSLTEENKFAWNIPPIYSCPICLEDIPINNEGEKKEVAYLFECSKNLQVPHVHCEECLERHLQLQEKCTICRGSIPHSINWLNIKAEKSRHSPCIDDICFDRIPDNSTIQCCNRELRVKNILCTTGTALVTAGCCVGCGFCCIALSPTFASTVCPQSPCHCLGQAFHGEISGSVCLYGAPAFACLTGGLKYVWDFFNAPHISSENE